MYLSSELKNLRVSRDWVGDRWVDIEPNPNILCIISMSVDTKLSTSSAASKEAKSDNSPPSVDKLTAPNKLSAVEEEMHVDLEGMTLTNVPLKDECMDAEQQQRMFDDDEEEREYSRNLELEQENIGGANGDEDGNVKVNSMIDDINGENNLVECEIACEAEAADMLTDC